MITLQEGGFERGRFVIKVKMVGHGGCCVKVGCFPKSVSWTDA